MDIFDLRGHKGLSVVQTADDVAAQKHADLISHGPDNLYELCV